MMRSMFAGVAGLKNHQTKMDVIGNNIANVNTVGFKRGRVNFQEMLVQTLRGASSPQSGRGGVNAMQIGLGVSAGSIDTVQTQGNLQNTGKNTDIALQGDGYFVLLDDSGQVFTRSGVFDLDKDGNMINSSNGMKIMGWAADTTGKINTNASLTSLNIPIGQSMKPSATGVITFANNLDASAIAGKTAPHVASIEVYDSQGSAHTISTAFSRTTVDNQWTYKVSLATSDPQIQKYITTYYPNYDTLTVDDQANVVEAAQKAALEGFSTVSGIGADLAGINVTALKFGSQYDKLSVKLIDPGVLTASTTVSVTGVAPDQVINVTLKHNGTAITATLQEVIDAINTHATAGTLVKASLDPTVTGTTVAKVDTPQQQFLKGGSDIGGAWAIKDGFTGNPDLRVVAQNSGLAGNNIQVKLVAGGATTTTAVTGTGTSADPYLVTVTYATAPAANMQNVIDSINTHATAKTLVLATTDTPAAVPAAMGAYEALAGGGDSTRYGYVSFNSLGQLDSDATRTLNGATSPDMVRAFAFKPDTANQVKILMDLKQLTQYTSAFTAVAQKQDGNPTGTLQTFAIDGTGKVSGIYSNGFSKEMAILAVANFNNPGGLIKIGDNIFKRSNNSGLEQVGTAGTGGRGTVTPGALEMSNVDLSQEFTDMITTQRGFQANSRIITTSDEMLQELVNLKR